MHCNWGVDLPVDLPVWTLTVEMWICYSWPLDVSTGRGRSASWSANMNSHSRNVNLLFLTTRCQYWGVGRSASWSSNMNSRSRNVNLLYLTTRCQSQGVDLPIWTLTSILHVKLGKYELSYLKYVIVIWRVFQGCQGVSRGCYIWHDSTMLTDCLLP